jgi:hypothetical protein
MAEGWRKKYARQAEQKSGVLSAKFKKVGERL